MTTRLREACRNYYRAHPDAMTREIADANDCAPETVRLALREAGMKVPGRKVWRVKVDREEVQRLFTAGVNKNQIAQRLGVTPRTIGAALNGGYTTRNYCRDCGATIDAGSIHCRLCYPLHAIKMNDQGELWCPGCETYKPETEFPRNRNNRVRLRHNYCRLCNTRLRREYRQRHPGRDAATARARHRRKKEEAETGR